MAAMRSAFFQLRSPAILRQGLRFRSSISGEDRVIEIELSSQSSGEDLVQRLMVQKATPDWLPFIPGASFWVPPRSSAPILSYADLIASLPGRRVVGDPSLSLLLSRDTAFEQGMENVESAKEEDEEDLAVIEIKISDKEGSSGSSENGEG